MSMHVTTVLLRLSFTLSIATLDVSTGFPWAEVLEKVNMVLGVVLHWKCLYISWTISCDTSLYELSRCSGFNSHQSERNSIQETSLLHYTSAPAGVHCTLRLSQEVKLSQHLKLLLHVAHSVNVNYNENLKSCNKWSYLVHLHSSTEPVAGWQNGCSGTYSWRK